MKLTAQEIKENAQDWIGASQGLTTNEKIDRKQLAEQFSHTIADSEDIEAIAKEIESRLASKITYKVVEDNGGGLTIFIWDDNGKMIYSHCGYEYGNISENLRDDIKALQGGDDFEIWDGNEVKDEYEDGDINPESDWDNICNSEYGYQIIVDSGTAYPHRMGGNGLRAIFGMRDFDAAEDMPEEVLI